MEGGERSERAEWAVKELGSDVAHVPILHVFYLMWGYGSVF